MKNNSLLQKTSQASAKLGVFTFVELMQELGEVNAKTVQRYLCALKNNGNLKKLTENTYKHISNKQIKVQISSPKGE